MRLRAAPAIAAGFLALLTIAALHAQLPGAPAVIRDLDAANQARFDNVLSFTDVEHYTVFRGDDQTNPAAEMTVKMTYKKGVGKEFVIVKQSGSSVIQKFGLEPLLANEKSLNDPSIVAQTWFTSANYKMRLKPDANRTIDGRQCLAIEITPYRKAPNMLDGTIWVDSRTHTLAEVEGVASKSPSVFAKTTKMMRRYTDMHGYAMAVQARAESSSLFFGKTVVVIDYTDYHFQLRPGTK